MTFSADPTYKFFNAIATAISAPPNYLFISRPNSLSTYAQCFDFFNKQYVFVAQFSQNIAGRLVYEAHILSISGETLSPSGFSKINFFESLTDGSPAPDPTEKSREVRNSEDNCIACKERYQLSHNWRFNKLIGLSNYSKDSEKLVLAFESLTEEIKQINGVSEVNSDCIGGYIPAQNCLIKKFPIQEDREIKQNYYTFLRYNGEITMKPYQLLSEDQANQSISDDPSSFQIFTSVAPNNGTPFITVDRIK